MTDFVQEFEPLPDKRLLEIVAAYKEFHPDAVKAAVKILTRRKVEFEHLLQPPKEEEVIEPEPEEPLTDEEVAIAIEDKLQSGQTMEVIRENIVQGSNVNAFDLFNKDIDQGIVKGDVSEAKKAMWKQILGIVLLVIGIIRFGMFFATGYSMDLLMGLFFMLTGLYRITRKA